MQSLLSNSRQRIANILVQFMFAYIDNTYFSAAWWESLSEVNRIHLTALAEMSNAYYTDFSYEPAIFVPWQVTDILIGNSTLRETKL